MVVIRAQFGDSYNSIAESKQEFRSCSPRKSALQFGLGKLVFQNFSDAEASTFPQKLQHMKDNIGDFSDGSEVLPFEVQV